MTATTYQRARRPAQKEERRAQLLSSARELLDELGDVHKLSLTDLAKRAGMAKSNTYRYFESREAVLLAILDLEWDEWEQEVVEGLPAVDPGDAALSAFLAQTAAARPIMCQLVAALPSVLEHNVSADTVAEFKVGAIQRIGQVALALFEVRPAHPVEHYAEFFHHILAYMAGAWPFAHPSPVVEEVLRADEFAAFRHDFEKDLARTGLLMLRGLAMESA